VPITTGSQGASFAACSAHEHAFAHVAAGQTHEGLEFVRRHERRVQFQHPLELGLRLGQPAGADQTYAHRVSQVHGERIVAERLVHLVERVLGAAAVHEMEQRIDVADPWRHRFTSHRDPELAR